MTPWTTDELDRIGEADELASPPLALRGRSGPGCRSGSCARATSCTCGPTAALSAMAVAKQVFQTD